MHEPGPLSHQGPGFAEIPQLYISTLRFCDSLVYHMDGHFATTRRLLWYRTIGSLDQPSQLVRDRVLLLSEILEILEMTSAATSQWFRRTILVDNLDNPRQSRTSEKYRFKSIHHNVNRVNAESSLQ